MTIRTNPPPAPKPRILSPVEDYVFVVPNGRPVTPSMPHKTNTSDAESQQQLYMSVSDANALYMNSLPRDRDGVVQPATPPPKLPTYTGRSSKTKNHDYQNADSWTRKKQTSGDENTKHIEDHTTEPPLTAQHPQSAAALNNSTDDATDVDDIHLLYQNVRASETPSS